MHCGWIGCLGGGLIGNEDLEGESGVYFGVVC